MELPVSYSSGDSGLLDLHHVRMSFLVTELASNGSWFYE